MPQQNQEPTVVQNPTQTTVQNPTQVNQTQNQIQATQSNVFDPSTLSPEALRWVDQQRTQASQTARKNLMKDESFLSEVRNSMLPGVQQQAQQTVEERITTLENSLKQANQMTSRARVEAILAPLGLADQAKDIYVDMFATEDIASSIEKANSFVTAFNQSLDSKITQQTQQAMNNMPTPMSQTPISEATTMQEAFDNLKKSNMSQMRKQSEMARMIREAASKGINLV